jgi:hypothetical protein
VSGSGASAPRRRRAGAGRTRNGTCSRARGTARGGGHRRKGKSAFADAAPCRHDPTPRQRSTRRSRRTRGARERARGAACAGEGPPRPAVPRVLPRTHHRRRGRELAAPGRLDVGGLVRAVAGGALCVAKAGASSHCQPRRPWGPATPSPRCCLCTVLRAGARHCRPRRAGVWCTAGWFRGALWALADVVPIMNGCDPDRVKAHNLQAPRPARASPSCRASRLRPPPHPRNVCRAPQSLASGPSCQPKAHLRQAVMASSHFLQPGMASLHLGFPASRARPGGEGSGRVGGAPKGARVAGSALEVVPGPPRHRRLDASGIGPTTPSASAPRSLRRSWGVLRGRWGLEPPAPHSPATCGRLSPPRAALRASTSAATRATALDAILNGRTGARKLRWSRRSPTDTRVCVSVDRVDQRPFPRGNVVGQGRGAKSVRARKSPAGHATHPGAGATGGWERRAPCHALCLGAGRTTRRNYWAGAAPTAASPRLSPRARTDEFVPGAPGGVLCASLRSPPDGTLVSLTSVRKARRVVLRAQAGAPRARVLHFACTIAICLRDGGLGLGLRGAAAG